MRWIKGRLTYANIVATLALFIAVGGASAFAAAHLAKNSVGTKQIKNQAVTAAKIKNGTLTGAQINVSTLGIVPSAAKAETASSSLTAATAQNSNNLGGAPANAYEPRPQWALVRSDGTILAQSGGITINNAFASSGLYFLDFGISVANRPISVVPHYGDPGLAAEASATPCGGSSVPGGWECTETAGVNDAQHLFVEMHDSSGADTPFGFYVTVGN
jgi:hypothetical protein